MSGGLLDKIQVSIPFWMIKESFLARVIEHGIHPEIGFDADVIERYRLSDFADVSRALHQRGLRMTLHFPFLDLSPGSLDRAVRSLARYRFEQMLPVAGLFHPKLVVCSCRV